MKAAMSPCRSPVPTAGPSGPGPDGAEGVHSQTRMAVLGLPPATFGNRIAWRALVPQDAVSGLIDMDRATVHMAGVFHLVCYPLPQRRQVNLALFMPSRSADAENAHPRPSGGGRRVARIVATANGQMAPLALNTVVPRPLESRQCHPDRDAAHAMVPFQARAPPWASRTPPCWRRCWRKSRRPRGLRGLRIRAQAPGDGCGRTLGPQRPNLPPALAGLDGPRPGHAQPGLAGHRVGSA